MPDIKLTATGTLLRRASADAPKAAPAWDDVSLRAHEFLFSQVKVEDGFTLAHLFELLAQNPLLIEVFRQDFAKEFVDYVKATPVDYKSEGSELSYLELYQVWSFDSHTKTYGATDSWQLHAAGPAEEENQPGPKDPQGLTYWSISMTDVRKLLPLPLRIQHDVCVAEDDMHSNRYLREIDRVQVETLTLGQLIHGVLWELSFYGSPEEATEQSDELRRRIAELEDHLASSEDDVIVSGEGEGATTAVAGTFDSAEDLFESLGVSSKTAYPLVFQLHSQDVTYPQANSLLRELDDAVNANEGLLQLSEGKVSVAEQYVALSARNLRAEIYRLASNCHGLN